MTLRTRLLRHTLPVAVLTTTAAATLALLPGTASAVASSVPVNVHVDKSDGTDLSGVGMSYSCNGGPTLRLGSGTTDANGHVGPAMIPVGNTCQIFANYRGSSATKTITVVNSDNNVWFQTSLVTVTLADHANAPLSGGSAAYVSAGISYWLNPAGQTASTTDATGQITGQMFDGTYTFRMQYNTGAQLKAGIVVSGPTTVAFQTGMLTLVYSGLVSFGQGSPTTAWFTKAGTELLPGTYLFQPKGSGCTSVSIDAPDPGTTATKTVFAARLLDHNGNPLAGGVARYAPGGSWFSMGTTDSSGSYCQVVDGALGNVKVGLTYRQVEEQKTQNVADNSVFTFQTALGTIRLLDHTGAGLAGGVVDQGGSVWVTGTATTNGSGYAYVELLPGHTYTFRMNYNYLNQIKTGDPTDTAMVFQTGQLVLRYSGSIQGSLGGGWVTFTKPSMELFAGTYTFRFGGGYDLPMTVTTAAVNDQSVVTAKLTNHLGQAISGAKAEYAPGGSWLTMPNTNAGGWTGVSVAGALGNTQVRITYHQHSKALTQHQPTASHYAFQTALGTIRLVDHAGAGLAGGVVDQGGGSWDLGIATTNASGYAYVELFAGTGNYTFKMNYNNTSQQLSADPTSATMSFQTGAVHSDTNTATLWANGSWLSFVQDMEVLPGTYPFRFSDGTSQTSYPISAGVVNHIH
jgi:hypothetical protein